MRGPGRRLVGVLFACGSALLPAVLIAQTSFPQPQGRVTDLAHVIDDRTKDDLLAVIHDTERATSAELAVVTVSSLEGMSVEEYAVGLFKAWGIGKKGIDNGVLILVAPSERRMRIEVGYGLESVLPDGLAGEIIRTDFTPAFKNNDYSGGIDKGVRHVAAIVTAMHVLTPEERKVLAQDTSTGGDQIPTLISTPFFGVFIAIGAFAVGLGARAKAAGPMLFGALFGGVPGLMALIPAMNASLWVLGPLGLGLLILGYRRGGSANWRAMARGTGSRTSDSSSWVMGGGSSGGSSSSSSSSSDSFGGGESGGGGASGSW